MQTRLRRAAFRALSPACNITGYLAFFFPLHLSGLPLLSSTLSALLIVLLLSFLFSLILPDPS